MTVTSVISAKTQLCVVVVVMVMGAAALNGPNVCMVKQKYNITKRVKYRAPMSVRTYEWCMSIPPRCSKWSTEMRDLTRLETEERTAEVAVCCPGYKMKDVSCVPICPPGRTGHACSQDCPADKWGPNCVHPCPVCEHGACSPLTGSCECHTGWQGESCESRMSPSTSTTSTTTAKVEELTNLATKPTLPPSTIAPTTALLETTTASIPATSKTTLAPKTTTKPTTIANTSHKTSTIQSTTTPRIIVAENISNSKKDAKLETTKLKSEMPLEERSTLQSIPSTSLPISTQATTQSTAKPTMLSTRYITKTVAMTTNKPTTTETIEKETTVKQSVMVAIKPNTELTKTVITATTETYDKTTLYNNVTLRMLTTEMFTTIPKTTHIPISTRAQAPQETRIYPKEVHVAIKTTPVRIVKTISDVPNPTKTTAISVFTEAPIATTHATTITEGTRKVETTRRPDATIRYFPTTVKFKPKEIWIRPAQKGQESFAEAKKNYELHARHRIVTNKETVPNTTPKTIIVSIIPTSVSYTTFKKIALSTTSLLPQVSNVTDNLKITTGQGITKPMSILTTLTPPSSTTGTLSTSIVTRATKLSTTTIVNASKSNEHFTKVVKTHTTLPTSRMISRNQTVPSKGTNSMTTVTQNLNSSNSITPTVSSTNFIKTTHKPNLVVTRSNDITSKLLERVTKPINVVTAKPKNVAPIGSNRTAKIDDEKTNATKTKEIVNATPNKLTTESPDDEETFHILTEPEHITAVMDEKGRGKTSVDLISVISIAGGIMMAVITVAVVIVMVERCRRPRYDDVRKMNDIHMQVMIDNNDVPPPYVRSIFHTPLPDPPSSDKCHYQPISTLDRNLKQFMRPVVVQTISPIMLENFREILECHYDHLPRRSHEDYEVRQKHCSISPSCGNPDELAHLRPCSIAESTIDALKCEAELDVLDSTTSEPLYAEIPCWRPPSEHAIEVMNYNGEAVTEL